MSRRSRIALLASAGALALAPAAAAQDLNPPAPDFYDCHADGARTICVGSQLQTNDPAPTGVPCGTGADAFEVWDEGVIHQRAKRIYDANGDLVRRTIHERWTDTQWSNPATGAYVPYTQMNTITDVLAVPGDFSSATETLVGENIYRDPATHRVVLRNVGRLVISPEGEILASSGSQPFLQAFFENDQSVFDRLCAVLASPPAA